MLLAFHVIISTYGFWLPNDPRGSWSDFVAAWELFKFGGKATKVDTHRSVARRPHDRSRRIEAKQHLKYPPVIFNEMQIQVIAKGFERACAEGGYLVYACAILRDHVHLVIGPTQRRITKVVSHLKQRATEALGMAGLRPESPVWAEGCWKVFLFSNVDVARAIEYAQDNPIKHGQGDRQEWEFLTPYLIL